MTHFPEYQATERLKALAKNPFDLTREGALAPERIARYQSESVGYKLLYATERVDDEVLQALTALAEEAGAVESMERMQDGAIVNKIEGYPSENRAALHTATRDLFDKPRTASAAVEATALAREQVEKLKRFMEKIDAEGRFTDLITVAIGGSDLGPKANFHAMEYLLKPGRRVHFISNVDPDDAACKLRGLDLSKSLVVVISKSGGTLETLTNEALVRAQFEAAGLNPKDHFVAVTGKGSPLDDPEKYLESFYMWDWIGGRYSTTSMVGGVMLSFAFGFDVFMEFLKGCHAMDRAACNRDPKNNVPLMGALLSIWNHNFLNYPTLALIPYAEGLARFPAHIQQVEMESNGKRIGRDGNPVNFQTGMIIWGEPGTNGQHSFFQLLHQGTAITPIEFIGFKEGQYQEDLVVQGTNSHQKLLSNLFAQAVAMAQGQESDNPNKVFLGNRPSHLLLAERLTPFALGALLSYFEHKVAFEGFIWGINSFDQEGVQLGKVLANRFIDRFAGRGEPYPVGDALIEQLNGIYAKT